MTLSVLCLSAQSVNLSGTWLGTSTFLKDQFQLTYELKQNGATVLGFSTTKNLTNGDSIRVAVRGAIQGTILTLAGVEVIYQSGFACMSDSRLSYSVNNGKGTLSGRWKGNRKLSTCLPMTSGSIMLVKQEELKDQQVTVYSEQADQHIALTDEIGNALINELGRRKFYALIIGINNYQDDGIQDLDNPIGDARKLAAVLTSDYSFEEGDVTVLEDPDREKVIQALDGLAAIVNEKDNLLIFYAGHGIWNSQLSQGYWLPSDASLDSKSFWLSNSTLRDYVGGIKSKHTLLISDACFSGGILKERAIFNNSRAILEVYKLPSRKAMTSGTLNTVPDESVFMKYLIKNLMQNQSPLLSADQLFRDFKTAVINNSPNGQVPQYGPINQAGDEGGDFVFLKRERN